MVIFKQFSFEAAHLLPNVPTGHKCGRLHGHSYHLDIYVSGDIQEHTGWVLDFAEVKNAVKDELDILDHNYLNSIPGLENPTSEMLASWLWSRVLPKLPGLRRIVVNETCTSGCIYEGDSHE